MAGAVWWWEYEVAGHIVSAAIGKQRRMRVLSRFLMKRKYTARLPIHGVVLPTLRVIFPHT